jgi:tetratricopeptide (TPR) repeat protein
MARATACLARAQVINGEAKEALASAEQAMALAAELLGPDHEDVALAVVAKGEVLSRMGRWNEALTSLQRGMEIYEKTAGREHWLLVDPLLGIGRSHLGRGDAGAAVAALRRALAICDRSHLGGKWRAEIQFHLARGLALIGERTEALAVAQEARAWYASSPLTRELTDIDAWLTTNRPR